MALIKYGGGVTEMSGKMGGNVFSRNRYGAYVRKLTTPVNPASDRQVIARARVSSMADRWNNTLTEAQRVSWNVYAAAVSVLNRLGDSIYLTGFNHYIRSNCAILACGGTIVDDGPAILLLPGQDPAFAVTASAATQLVSVAFDDALDWLDEDGGYMSVQMGTPKLTSVNFFAGPWRFMDAIEGDSVTPPTTPTTMTAPWTITEDQKIWCQARIIRADGRISNFFRDSTPVAA
jgi:hypothetical protein